MYTGGGNGEEDCVRVEILRSLAAAYQALFFIYLDGIAGEIGKRKLPTSLQAKYGDIGPPPES
jgi:hypothetical protein